MWKRSELKRQAKASIKRNYLACILAGLILLFAVGWLDQASMVSELEGPEGRMIEDMYSFLQSYLMGPMQVLWSMIRGWLGATAGIVFLVLRIFVFNPLEVGGCAFFTENTEGMPTAEKVFSVFKNPGYKNIVGILIIRDIKLYLWYLLLIIPGIIKSLEYRMIPYILAENPQAMRVQVFGTSKYMMMGEKLKAFILDLSFLLWDLLTSLTFGLAGIFFVNPYEHATNAELYRVLKEK